MSRRDAGAAGQQARHARDRLRSALGGGPPGLLQDGPDPDGFEYRGTGQPDQTGTEPGSGGGRGTSPRVRWRVGLRVAALLAAVAAAAGAWFWWQAGAVAPEILPLSGVASGRSHATPEDTAAGAAEGPQELSPDSGGAVSGGLVVVHVAGAVANPGVIRLRQGSRVDDAIAAAGGPVAEADVNRLNLALVIEDGQKIHVPRIGEPPSTHSGTAGADGSDTTGEAAGPGQSGGKINLNTAGVAELDTLPKVGPVLAQRIVDWRKEHGPFKSAEELDAVDGVGPKMLESLLPLVTV
ncbi:helix-hairpin-helix domain-containing protein [Arthrobacter sp. SLBN-112]|uniref:helix-hairpin-helix domain-containing protein n=1 Tax=Arthrobacter sp. SLBN-112 TaxID=2768452 RepID=UPI0027B36781|nr:helix-hairpin-helix domain-containing protein [Arthrobacter sp. SLBN-112]MDQ0801107.1 competence protein ComEA [Arthrobacter sp. SLBN-112]